VIAAERHGRVALLTLNRPQRRNALDSAHCRGLIEALDEAVADGSRAVVVTGSGPSFCAGADLDEAHDEPFRQILYQALHAVAAVPVPTVAAVSGAAVGAGTQLAMACDLRVAAPDARFAIPTARNGLAVDPWTVRRLAQLAGGGTARGILIGCDQLDAPEARACGLVNRIGGLDEALGWAAEIAELAPLSLTYSLRALDAVGADVDHDPELLAAFARCWASDDVREAARARTERRRPVFTGR
jgi:enoyl-CoA hydratase